MNWDVVVKNYLLSNLQLVSAKAEAVAGSVCAAPDDVKVSDELHIS